MHPNARVRTVVGGISGGTHHVLPYALLSGHPRWPIRFATIG